MFQKWGGHCDTLLANSETTDLHGPQPLDEHEISREISGTAQDQRRSINYLHILAHARAHLSDILRSSPYHMPPILLDKLKNVQDIQTLVRKHVGVHFDSELFNCITY